MTQPAECIIYARQSSDRLAGTGDAREGAAVERQVRECRELAERLGFTVVDVLVDNDRSATNRRVVRENFEALVERKPTHVIAWHLDRIARVSRDVERLLEAGILVHTVTGGSLDLATPAGRAVARTVTAWSTYEGEQRTARQKASFRQAREAGRVTWSVRPWGYNLDGSQRPDEAEHLREAYRRLDRGDTVESIRQWLNSVGSVTPKGNAWRHSSLLTALRNPRNGGLVPLPPDANGDRALVPATNFEGVLSADEWRRIVGKATHRNMTGRGQGKRKHLLSGVMVCGRCGGSLTKGVQPRTGRAIYSGPCAHVTAPLDAADRAVRNALVRHLTSPLERLRLGRDTVPAEALAAVQEAPKVRQRLDDLADMLAAGEIDRASYARAATRLRGEVERLEALAETATQPDMPWIGKSPGQLLALWGGDELSLVAKQALLRAAFRSIELLPKSPGKRFHAPTHLRITDHDGRVLMLPDTKEADALAARRAAITEGEA